MPGQVVHIEIPADDTVKAREFWSSLFGWQFEAFPGPSEYHMTQISDQTGGAITNMEPGKRGTRAYFDVDDINAGAARVKELGGEADEPQPVPAMGWFATCRDTHGNEFGLWQNDPSAPTPSGQEQLDMQEKITTFLTYDDQAEEAVNFYTSIFDDSRVTSTRRYGDAGPGPKGPLRRRAYSTFAGPR